MDVDLPLWIMEKTLPGTLAFPKKADRLMGNPTGKTAEVNHDFIL